MRQFIILSLLTVCSLAFADPCVIIEKNGLQYKVTSYFDKDGTPKTAIYKSVEEIQKIAPIVAKAISGFDKDSDRIIIYFNEDETVNRIDCHVLSTKKEESLQSKPLINEEIDETAKTDIEALKTELKR